MLATAELCCRTCDSVVVKINSTLRVPKVSLAVILIFSPAPDRSILFPFSVLLEFPPARWLADEEVLLEDWVREEDEIVVDEMMGELVGFMV